MRKLALALLLFGPLAGCVAGAVIGATGAVVGATGAVVGATVGAAGAVVDVVVPDGDDKDEDEDD